MLTEVENKILDGFGLRENDSFVKRIDENGNKIGEWIICASCGATLLFRHQWSSQYDGSWCQTCSRPLALLDPISPDNGRSNEAGIERQSLAGSE